MRFDREPMPTWPKCRKPRQKHCAKNTQRFVKAIAMSRPCKGRSRPSIRPTRHQTDQALIPPLTSAAFFSGMMPSITAVLAAGRTSVAGQLAVLTTHIRHPTARPLNAAVAEDHAHRHAEQGETKYTKSNDKNHHDTPRLRFISLLRRSFLRRPSFRCSLHQQSLPQILALHAGEDLAGHVRSP